MFSCPTGERLANYDLELIDSLHADMLELKGGPMAHDELLDRILELFPPLGDVGDWRWDETEAGEPIVLIEMNASFTGLDKGDVLLCGPIPNTPA